MNEDPLRRRLQALEIPPADPVAANEALEKALDALEGREAAGNAPSGIRRSTQKWTWRDWLWPSPIVWGAFAAIWLVVAARSVTGEHPIADQTGYAAAGSPRSHFAEPRDRFFALTDYRDLLPELRPLHRTP